jgi:uncharacterized NAD-dependent epimerase/dehydratase family protein
MTVPILKFPEINSNSKKQTAIVYCENNFGETDGKTANGLIRHSEKYKILAVIDSSKAGLDAGMILDGIPNNIPVCLDLTKALRITDEIPDNFIFGMAPLSGMLSERERSIMLKAIKGGMNVVNGLHQFLNDDPEFIKASRANKVTIFDVRKPRDKKDLRVFTGRINEVTCPRIAVLGTDGAIGKRTTATILTKTLNDHGIKAVMVSTGQTGLIQGARYGIAIDAIAPQFCSGEIEATIIEAYEREKPDVIIIEGQGALSHPAYLTSAYILRGSRPEAVILQHAPKRINLSDYPDVPMPSVMSEINLIETFTKTNVIGITINHENMSDQEISTSISLFEEILDIPATDALTRPKDDLINMVMSAFPELKRKTPVVAV